MKTRLSLYRAPYGFRGPMVSGKRVNSGRTGGTTLFAKRISAPYPSHYRSSEKRENPRKLLYDLLLRVHEALPQILQNEVFTPLNPPFQIEVPPPNESGILPFF